VHGVLARCTFKNLSWFPVSDYTKNSEYMGDRKFTEVYMRQKLS